MMIDSIRTGGDASALAACVQATFERLWHERMAGMPFVNDRLRVELVGLRRWRGLWLGVLVTPWFMNLLLLPGDGGAPGEEEQGSEPQARWPRPATGESAPFVFPAGRFEFIAGREAGVGEYLACSLFSPMFEFADHDSARLTAEACLAALFKAGEQNDRAEGEPKPVPAPSKRDFLRGRWPRETTAPGPTARSSPGGDEHARSDR